MATVEESRKIRDEQLFELEERIAKGDKIALEQLYKDHFKIIYRYIRNYCRLIDGFVDDQGVIKDIIQEMFIDLWEKGKQGKKIRNGGPSTIVGVLIARGRREVFSHIVTQTARRDRHTKYYKDFTVFEAMSGADWDREVEKVRKVLQGLPNKQKQVFMLAKYEFHSYGEIASILGIAKATVATHMQKTFKLLEKEFGKKTLNKRDGRAQYSEAGIRLNPRLRTFPKIPKETYQKALKEFYE